MADNTPTAPAQPTDPKAGGDQPLSTADIAGGKPDQRPTESRSFDEPEGQRLSPATATDPRLEADPGAVQPTDGAPEDRTAPLFAADEAKRLKSQWDGIQAGFVDEPRAAVEKADALVASAMQRLAEMFAEERAKLEHQWDKGEKVDTEDLRLVLRRYRSFFGRLLAI